MPATSMDQIVNLAKRRGFVFPASEIYGGLNSCWDYGPLGVELKRNVKDAWWRSMVSTRRDVVGLDSAVLQHPQVWRTSGHVDNFSDPLIDCRKCKARFRADDLASATCSQRHDAPINDECRSHFTAPRAFNLMFSTHLGPVEGEGSLAYLRPETAQGIFTNYLNVQTTARLKPPFGVAQIGKSFRNEITPGNFIFRTREFEQMEMEYFVPPADWQRWFDYWREQRFQWYVDLGIDPANLRRRDHEATELAHYSNATTDIEYRFAIGWKELEGVASRTDFDLKRHSEASGRQLEYFDGQTRERFMPWVIEPAAGVDRALLAFLSDAYEEQNVAGAEAAAAAAAVSGGAAASAGVAAAGAGAPSGSDGEAAPKKGGKDEDDIRTVLHLHPRLAPIKVAIFPLVKKEGMPEFANRLEEELRRHGVSTFYDQSGAIGRRYRRQDEIGTPWCVTVDGESLTAGTVTLRDRDSMLQERVQAASLAALIAGKLTA